MKLFSFAIVLTTAINDALAQSSNGSILNSSNPLFNYIGIPKNNTSPALPMSPNATGQLVQAGFSPPNGSDSEDTWTWTTAVYDLRDYDTVDFPLGFYQQLWLRTQPEHDLVSSTSHHAGCFFLLQNLPIATLKAGQSDDGSCGSIFNSSCLNAIKSSFQDGVLRHQDETYQPKAYNGTKTFTYQPDICGTVAGNFSMPPECGNATGLNYNDSSLISVRESRVYIINQ
ncbi:MAG: hypothetical protein M1821_002417 [Bathelium mastoideum]|nr:MAG: hypothetical protein M1821_002417 [Bathelium mastoideum]